MKKTIALMTALASTATAVYADGELTETAVSPIEVVLTLPTGNSLSGTSIASGFQAAYDTGSKGYDLTSNDAKSFGEHWLGEKSSPVDSDKWYIGAGNGKTADANKLDSAPLYTYVGTDSFSATARTGYKGTYNAWVIGDGGFKNEDGEVLTNGVGEPLTLSEVMEQNPENHYFHISFSTKGGTGNNFALFGWNGSSYKLLTSGDVNGNAEFETNVAGYSQLVAIWGALGGGSTNTVSGISAMLVPEPATATLSLLALAGLAARRRRK